MASVLKNKGPNVSVLLCFSCFLMTFRPVSMESASPVFACDVDKNPHFASFRFCNKSLGIDERVADLVENLTFEEKISFLVSGAGNVSKLGIPKYEWWSEALHGVSNLGPGTRFSNVVPGATSFPQVVSTEARAMYNEGLAGLTFWSPNVNIFRDPRWGRGQETPGEDPLLSSKYASAYVRGLQQTDDGDPNRLKVAACCKHYTAYDLDNPKETDRFHFNALVTEQDMEDTFKPPFKSCVIDGKVASVMCSYNQVNGKPTCADPGLLEGVIRGKWNLNGYIVSDCDSLDVFFNSQHYTGTAKEAAADALRAGLDLDCGSFLSKHTEAAVEVKLVKESSINRAISNNFATLMRLGFFDGDPRNQNYGNLGRENVCTPDHKKLARLAARQGIVLLKNTAGSLPLSPVVIETLAVIGPNADAKETMIGNYKGIPCNYTTPLQGLKAVVERTTFVAGCSNVACISAKVDDAKTAAASADATVLVMGADQSIEAEGRDRVDILLPGQQPFLVSEVASVSKGPVILVIMSGGGMDISFAKYNDKIKSILWVGYPGEAGGAAIADVIFGDHNPSGRLPMTWYPQSYVERVQMTNMNMRPDPSNFYPGRTYRFYIGETVYSFGEGLSYTTFTRELTKAPDVVSVAFNEDHVCRSSSFDIHLIVKNTGSRSGGHTVLLFFSPPISVHKAPHKQLIAFEKVFLGEGAEKLVIFKLNACTDLSVVDERGMWKVPLGEYALHIGTLKHSFHVNIRSNLAELRA